MRVRSDDRFDALIRTYARKYALDWRRIKAQIAVESGFDPRARSTAGAMGLAQFMPATWDWVWEKLAHTDPRTKDPYHPEHAIEACAFYMSYLLSRFGEIPNENERYKFALAAYNAGRDKINRCLAYARRACGHPYDFRRWEEAGRPSGPWQRWSFASRFLPRVTGLRAAETIRYVEVVMASAEAM